MQDIGVRVGVQGEQQYRQQLANIVQTSKELAAEMKALTSGFDSTTSAQEQARNKMEVLNRQIENQTKYIETLNAKYKTQESTLNNLRAQLDKTNAEYGEGSKESQKLTTKIEQQETAMSKTRTSINNATTALNGMKNEMAGTEQAANGAAVQTDNLARATENAGDSAERASSGWTILKGMVANFASGLVSSAISNLKSLAKEAMGVSDSLTKFQNTMAFAGFNSAEIEATSKAMKDYADRTVYSLGEVSSVVAQLGANGVENFEKLVEAAGNLNAAAGGSADTFNTVGLVLTQTAGAGKLTAENWRQLMNAIPGASGKIQEALQEAGAYAGDLAAAMKDGEITAEEFNAAILKVGSKPIAVEAATSATTFEAKLARIKTTVIDGLTNALTILAPIIDTVLTGFNKLLTPIANLIDLIADGTGRVDSFTRETTDLSRSLDNWRDRQKELDEEVETGEGLIQTYRERLKNLEDQMWKNKAAGKDVTDIQREYSTIVDILNENIPDLNLTINEQNGLLDYNSQKILDNSKAWAEAKKAQVWQETFTEILAKQARAEAELETNRVKLKIATDDYNGATKRSAELQAQLDRLWDEFYSGAAEDPEALKAKIDEVTKSWEAENQKVGEAKDRMNKYSEAVGEGEKAMEEISKEVAEANVVFDNLMESQANYATQTKRILLDQVVPLYAQAARDASNAWNRNVNLKVYNPARQGLTTISAYKTGLAYVPYDGFIAELHKGERILTAAEALEYRNLRSPEAVMPVTPTTPDLSTINNNQRTTVTLNVYGAEGQDEEALAEIVMDKIQKSVNSREVLYA